MKSASRLMDVLLYGMMVQHSRLPLFFKLLLVQYLWITESAADARNVRDSRPKST